MPSRQSTPVNIPVVTAGYSSNHRCKRRMFHAGMKSRPDYVRRAVPGDASWYLIAVFSGVRYDFFGSLFSWILKMSYPP